MTTQPLEAGDFSLMTKPLQHRALRAADLCPRPDGKPGFCPDHRRGRRIGSGPARSGVTLLLLLLCLSTAAEAPAGDLMDFTGVWQYSKSGGDEIDSLQIFTQRYSLALDRRLTHALSFDAAASYNRNQGDNFATTESLVPTLSVGVSNDLFRAMVSGAATERWNTAGPDQSTRSWEATLGSAWQRRLWPSVRLSYGQTSTTDSETPPLNDISEMRQGFDLDWDLLLGRLFYRYSQRQSENRVLLSDSDSATHFARFETGRTFLQNRLDINLSQQVTQTTREFSAVTPQSGVFELPLEGARVLAAIDDSPETGPLTDQPGLANGDRDTVALIIQPNDRMNIGVALDNRRMDRLHLYVDPDPLNPLNPADAAALRWDLYTSIDNENWTRAAIDINAVYDGTRKRFELNTGSRQAFFLKVVVTSWPVLASVRVTEVEAIRLLAADGLVSQTDRYTNYLTAVNMGVRFTPSLSASSSLAVESGDYSEGNDFSRWSASGNLRWIPNPFVQPTLGISQTTQETDGGQETINRSFSLFVATFPLPTLDVSLGATRSESYTDSSKTITSDRFSLLSRARLYPDLTAGLDLSISTTDNVQQNTTSDSLDTRLTLTSRLTPRLTADLQNNYQKTGGGSSGQDYNTTLSLNYRPSDLLSMRLTTTRYWGDSAAPDSLGFNLNLGLLSTPKTRMTFVYTFTDSESTASAYSLLWDWDISQVLALRNSANYNSATTDQWIVTSQLWLKF